MEKTRDAPILRYALRTNQSSHERGSIVRKADIHSEFSTKREESFLSLSFSRSLSSHLSLSSPPSLSTFPAVISVPRRRRPNGNVKVTWTTGYVAHGHAFLQPEIDTTGLCESPSHE